MIEYRTGDLLQADGAAPKMTPGRAALVLLLHRYLGGLMDPFVTLLEVQKLLYFMQDAGQPLRLSYTKAPYGPYAVNLRHVLDGATTTDAVVAKTHAWNERKRRFSPEQIMLARDVLGNKSWLDTTNTITP